jgi:hypothetical protein
MFKKFVLPISAAIILALVAGAWLTVDVFAKDNNNKDRLRSAKKRLGQVTVVSDQQFTIQRLDGQEVTFLVDEETRFRSRSETELNMGDLQVDQWVLSAGKKNESGEWIARLVVLMPDEFDPTMLSAATGKISEVDQNDMTFALTDRQGEAASFIVNDETRFSGGVQDFSDLETGMLARVGSKQQDDGSELALAVKANFPVKKYRGEITDINLSANTFTLSLRSGDQNLTFKVDEMTKFKGKEDSIGSLQDLQTGMMAVVAARPGSTESEQLVAQIVGAVEKDQLPKFDVRILGEVISVQDDTLVVQSRDGDEYTFQLTDDTRWMGRNPRLTGPEDLQAGMQVMVAGAETSQGKFEAQIVAGFQRKFSKQNF